MKKIMLWCSAVSLLWAMSLNVHAQAQKNPNRLPGNQNNSLVFCSVHSLQDAVDRAAEGGWIVVQETCYEEVVIRKNRLRIDGELGATIRPDGGVAFTILADGVEIRDMNIVGGSTGIEVARGSSAEAHNNSISEFTNVGVFIGGSSYGDIHDNVLNGAVGSFAAVFVANNGGAEIFDNTIATNRMSMIETNSNTGVIIAGSSSAQLGGNFILTRFPFLGAIHLNTGGNLNLAAGNEIGNFMGDEIFCSQSSSILVAGNQTNDPVLNKDPSCELLILPGVVFRFPFP